MENKDSTVERFNKLEARMTEIEKNSWCKRIVDGISKFFIKNKIALFFLIIFVFWLFYPFWMKQIFSLLPNFDFEIPIKKTETEIETKSFGELFGTFGDSFGALNTLFSGFAFAGIIISIALQSKELKATRDEVEAQRKEFEKQTAVFNKQTFENTFFQMLQQHNELIKSIINKDDKETLYGRIAIENYFNSLNRVYAENRSFSCSEQSEFFTQSRSAISRGEVFTNCSKALTC